MSNFTAILSRLDWVALVDIGLVALVIYAVLRLFRDTAAVQLLRGLLILALVIAVITNTLQLTAFTWLLSQSLPAILIAIPVIFQPELRRALERVGRTAPSLSTRPVRDTEISRLVSEIVTAVQKLSERKHGAIIVLEGETGLGEYIETGVALDSLVSSELLRTIFWPNTPLHDSAVIIRNARIVAAGCVLPLSPRPLSDTQMGTRHRAAIGITENSDALAVVVSEETGTISITRNGRIVRRLDDKRLRKILTSFFQPRTLFNNGRPDEAPPAPIVASRNGDRPTVSPRTPAIGQQSGQRSQVPQEKV